MPQAGELAAMLSCACEGPSMICQPHLFSCPALWAEGLTATSSCWRLHCPPRQPAPCQQLDEAEPRTQGQPLERRWYRRVINSTYAALAVFALYTASEFVGELSVQLAFPIGPFPIHFAWASVLSELASWPPASVLFVIWLLVILWSAATTALEMWHVRRLFFALAAERRKANAALRAAARSAGEPRSED